MSNAERLEIDQVLRPKLSKLIDKCKYYNINDEVGMAEYMESHWHTASYTNFREAIEHFEDLFKANQDSIRQQDEYSILYNKYLTLFQGKADTAKFSNYKSLTLSELKEKRQLLTQAVQREEMLLKLENEFTKGADFYDPTNGMGTGNLNPDNLKEIKVNKDNKYRDELRRMVLLFFENSAKIDPALHDINTLSKNFFSEAAKSIKEIYRLKQDDLAWLERIPKIGIVPKALRVGEQNRLSKCIIKDYKDVTEKFITNGAIPLFEKYNNQYNTIMNYIGKNIAKERADREFTLDVIDKMQEAFELRMKIDAKMMDAYTTNGVNIANTCNKIKKRGNTELLIKTVSTLVPFL